VNYLKTLILVATFSIFSTTLYAQGLLGYKLTNSNLTTSEYAPIIFTYILYTDHSYWAMITYDYFAGTSTTAPCSDMTRIATDDGITFITNYTDKVPSDRLVQIFGPAKTCVRFDIAIAGVDTIFTTGNTQLLWDENSKAYTAATPSKVTLDLSAGS
jgi:hypothetical protein